MPGLIFEALVWAGLLMPSALVLSGRKAQRLKAPDIPEHEGAQVARLIVIAACTTAPTLYLALTLRSAAAHLGGPFISVCLMCFGALSSLAGFITCLVFLRSTERVADAAGCLLSLVLLALIAFAGIAGVA